MMKEETISIQGLSIGYIHKKETKVIAKDMDATICSGELTCLLGANGAGKSTLLRTLSAFLKPLSGNIWIQGRRLSDYRDKELATFIGVVLTEKCQLRNITVTELVGMGRSPFFTGFFLIAAGRSARCSGTPRNSSLTSSISADLLIRKPRDA